MKKVDETPPVAVMRLEEKRVLGLEVEPTGTVAFTECCDYYYSESLSPEETREVARWLMSLADRAEAQ